MTYAYNIYKSKFKKAYPTAKVAGYKKNEGLWRELDNELLENNIPVPDFFDFIFEYTDKPYPTKLFKKTESGKSFLLLHKYLWYKDKNVGASDELTDEDLNQTYQDMYIRTGIVYMELCLRHKPLKRDTSFTILMNKSPVYAVYLTECGMYAPELNDYEAKAYKSIKSALLERYAQFITEVCAMDTVDLEERYLKLYKRTEALARLAPEIQVKHTGSIGLGIAP